MDNDDLRTFGASGRARTNPLPSAGRGDALLEHDANPEVHAGALELLKLWAVPTPVSQSAYDKAAAEARRRLSAGGLHPVNDPGVREPTHVSEADTEDSLLAEVRREFSSAYADDVGRAGAIDHLKAEVILAASGRPITADSYFRALHAVSSTTARATDDSDLDRHLQAAEAVSDLAEARLAERGIHSSASGFEGHYVSECSRIADEFHLDLYKRRS